MDVDERRGVASCVHGLACHGACDGPCVSCVDSWEACAAAVVEQMLVPGWEEVVEGVPSWGELLSYTGSDLGQAQGVEEEVVPRQLKSKSTNQLTVHHLLCHTKTTYTGHILVFTTTTAFSH